MNNTTFESHFGHPAQAAATAHGRVNLIGEHTDYCGGLVLPTLINQKIMVQISLRSDFQINGFSSEFGSQVATISEVASDSWLRFVDGAISLMNEHGANIKGINILTHSDILRGPVYPLLQHLRLRFYARYVTSPRYLWMQELWLC